MECQKCKKDFKVTKGLVKFCSLKCRNSRTQTEKANRARAQKWFDRWNTFSENERKDYIVNLSKPKTLEWSEKMANMRREKFAAMAWDDLGQDSKKNRVKQEQDYQCNKCNIKEWLGQQIPLEIDHINGVNDDYSRNNLEALCPNCHSLTPTWRGRNKPSYNGKLKVSDEELLRAIRKCSNIRQVLLMVGLSPRGKNYQRVKKLMGR